MDEKKFSTSTELANAQMLHDNLSESDKLLINAMANTLFVLLQNVRQVRNDIPHAGRSTLPPA